MQISCDKCKHEYELKKDIAEKILMFMEET